MQDGSISKTQLEDLQEDFILTKIEKESEEADLLFQLLTDIDEPTLKIEQPSAWRKQTLLRVLDFAKSADQVDDRHFTMYAYDQKGLHQDALDDTITGWYFYQLNEYWQFACTAIFNGLLNFLENEEGPNWMSVNDLVEKATTKSVERLNDENIFSAITIEETEREIYGIIRKANFEDRIYWGFKLVLKLFKENKNQLQTLKLYIEQRGIDGENDAVHYFINSSDSFDDSPQDFISQFIRHNIINRHRFVAYRKMGSGAQSTQKFMLENGYIRKIDNFEPGFTGPRLGNLLRFLHVLGYINDEWKVTDKGVHVLKQFTT
jgi:hypothetical protein